MSAKRRVAVVLAAGKGTRMRSELPKVLHPAAGRPLVSWVLDAARGAGCDRIVVVVGHGAEAVREAVAAPDVDSVLQAEQLGTGHALMQAAPLFAGAEPATLLVLSGDVPLVRPATLAALAEAAEAPGTWGALAVAELDEPGNLGRVLVDGDGDLERIVEARDATAEELAIQVTNSGLYAFPAPEVFAVLGRVDNDNAQGEIYLTDAPGLAVADGRRVAVVRLEDEREGWGVNTPDELARVDRVLASAPSERHEGATIGTENGAG
ncbi:MAG TPA: NTP transferase domain-containing protein [Thermoanaerobaculia bacterium]|nr:NTP transferase domain-containing protein [Thermoanaerobaculia bacterium]